MYAMTVINGQQLQVKEWQGQRVVTFRDIDDLHQRPAGTASRNFRKNRGRFIEGVDFFTLEPDEIRRLGLERPQGGAAEAVHLITEMGYLMLVKSFRDDLAWDVQRALVLSYFKGKIEPPRGYGLLGVSSGASAPLPAPDPEEVARGFLCALDGAIQRGEYYLRPAYHPEAVGAGQLLGIYTDESITIKSGEALLIYIAAAQAVCSPRAVALRLWPMLEALGLLSARYKSRLEDGLKCGYVRLDRSAINRLMVP